MDKYHLQKLFSKISKDLIKKKEIINSFYAIVRSKDLFIYFFFFYIDVVSSKFFSFVQFKRFNYAL